jgi:hypothetical protein
VLSRSPSANGSGGAILNKGTVEALVKCGAMDALHGRENRAAMLATIESSMSAAQKVAADKAAGQGGLFLGGGPGAGPATSKKPEPVAGALVKVTPWTEAETLASEKEALGFYVSSHPLTRWKQWASVFATATSETARSGAQNQRVVLPGLVQGIRAIIIKNGRSAGQKMGIVTVEDELGTVECVLFADCFAQFSHLLTQDAVVFMLGRVDRSRAGMVTGKGKQGGSSGGGEDDEGGAAGAGATGFVWIATSSTAQARPRFSRSPSSSRPVCQPTASRAQHPTSRRPSQSRLSSIRPKPACAWKCRPPSACFQARRSLQS